MKYSLTFITQRFRRGAGVLTLAAALAACGGGDDGAKPVLSGTAATGAPIVGGSVAVTCAGGAGLSAVTDASGTWSVSLSGQTLPCAVQVSGGTVGGAASTATLHSIALAFGTVNITPLTDLTVARLIGSAPSEWFAHPSFAGVTAEARSNAMQSIVSALGLGTALGQANPFTTAFQPVAGNAMDDLLEAIRSVLGTLSSDYVALLQAAASGDFAGFSGFPAGIEVALGGTQNCSAGTAMTYAQGNTGAPFSDGQTVCFEASTTQLVFQGKTLGNPVRNTAVQAPYSAYAFTEGSITYEVVFNADALYEINVSGTGLLGQFTPSAGSGGGTGNGGGSLMVDVAIGGTPSASFTIDNVPAPASESEFCSSIQNDSTFQSIGTQGGGTLTVSSCSFSNQVGIVDATLVISGMTINYRVTYRYL